MAPVATPCVKIFPVIFKISTANTSLCQMLKKTMKALQKNSPTRKNLWSEKLSGQKKSPAEQALLAGLAGKAFRSRRLSEMKNNLPICPRNYRGYFFIGALSVSPADSALAGLADSLAKYFYPPIRWLKTCQAPG